MTQYPSPYSPPPYNPQYAGYYPQRDPLAPAKRASWLMLAIAAIMCFCGICSAGFSRVNLADLPVESRMQFDQIEKQFQTTGISLHGLFIMYAVIAFVPGVAMAVLALFVRRGGMVSLVLALVLTGMLAAGIGVSIVTSFFAGPQAIAGACVLALPLAALVLLIVWLIQALRARPQASAMQSQYAAYYQQYMQAQQAYQQAYGYAAPPAQEPQQQQQPPTQNQPPTQGPPDAPPQG